MIDENKQYSWPVAFLMMVAGLGFAYLLYKTLPLLDLLNTFFMVVLVPLAFAVAVGLVSTGFYQSVYNLTVGWITRLKDRFDVKLKDLREGVDVRIAVEAAQPTPVQVST